MTKRAPKPIAAPHGDGGPATLNQTGTYEGQPVYSFRTLEDILALPIDKMGPFLKDLTMWFAMHKAAEAAPDQFKVIGHRGVLEWIDDGQHIARVNWTTRDGETGTHEWTFDKPEGAAPTPEPKPAPKPARQFTLTIDCDNDAFQTGWGHEVGFIMFDLCRRIGKDGSTDGVLRDRNGNTCGRWEFTP